MSASSITILVLFLHWIQSIKTSENPTADPTEIPTKIPTIYPTTNPTFEPTLEPSYNPTVEPTTNTAGPTITPPNLSFLQVICLDNNNEPVTQSNIILSEANGFNNNKYGKPSKESLLTDDVWNITNIKIPFTDTSNTCYLHIYLSNKDFWGYRSNSTCTLSFNINTNNVIDDTTLNLYNILDINQKYSTYWNIKSVNKTSVFFASYPTCQHLNGILDENINFASENVKNFIFNTGADFDAIINKNNGETLSSTGLFPYYFYLASNQTRNDSLFKMIPSFPFSSGQICVYDEALPIYDIDTKNVTNIVKGGIDYYLFANINSTNKLLNELNVNIEIKQICPGVIQPIMIIETTDEPFIKKENNYKFPLTLWILILLTFVVCFLCMAMANWCIYCFCSQGQEYENENKNENETQIQMEVLNNDEIMETLGIQDDDIDETEMVRFVVTEQDHQEMLNVLRKGSMSIGLQ